MSNKEVASQLFVTEKTVKFHLTNIYKKMAVKSRAQLIVWCVPHVDFVGGTSTASEAPSTNTPATTIAAAQAPIASSYNSGIIAPSNNNSGNTGSNSI